MLLYRFWIRKVFVSFGSYRFLYLSGSHPKGFRIFGPSPARRPASPPLNQQAPITRTHHSAHCMHAIPSPSPITSLSSSHPTTTMLSLFRHYYCCCYYYVMFTTILLCALVILNHSVTAFHITSQAPIVLFPSITSSSASSTTRISFSSSRVSTTSHHHSSSSALNMVRNRGLERRVEGATPLRKLLLSSVGGGGLSQHT